MELSRGTRPSLSDQAINIADFDVKIAVYLVETRNEALNVIVKLLKHVGEEVLACIAILVLKRVCSADWHRFDCVFRKFLAKVGLEKVGERALAWSLFVGAGKALF